MVRSRRLPDCREEVNLLIHIACCAGIAIANDRIEGATRKWRVFKSSSFGTFSGAVNTAPVLLRAAPPAWKKDISALMLSSPPDDS
jgi:hypothetical protein